MVDWGRVSHITKVDPAKALPDSLAVLVDTDLIVVGGSDNVTASNAKRTIDRIRDAVPDHPILQEPYSPDHVSQETVAATDGIAVPAVYNGDRRNFLEKHLEFFTALGRTPSDTRGAGLPVLGELIRSRGREAVASITDQIIGEGYVIQNPDSRAAAVTGATTPFTTDQVVGAAIATESFYRFPVLYIEYSGIYGGPEDVAAAAEQLDETVLLYGGGISSREQTREILDAGADAVVVGNCFHDDPEQFRETMP